MSRLPHLTAAAVDIPDPARLSTRASDHPPRMKAVIYHNPACATSRNVLALMRHAGVEPEVVEYLWTPPDRARLIALIAAAGLQVRDALREKGTPYAALGLADPALDDAQLLDAMLAHPILINRPFVQTDRGVRLARPSQTVLEILPPVHAPFRKEDGEVVIDAEGRGPIKKPGQ